MNPEPSEIESLLNTASTLPLSAKPADAVKADDSVAVAAPDASVLADSTTEAATDADSAKAGSATEVAAVDETISEVVRAENGDEGVQAAEPVRDAGEATADADGANATGVAVEVAGAVEPVEKAGFFTDRAVPAEDAKNSRLVLRFSPTPGAAFQSSLTLDLICVSPTAQIRYALGAAVVDESGLLYDPKDRIFITETTLIAARAYEDGQAGPLLSARFDIKKPQWQELEPTEQTDVTPHKTGAVLASPDGWQLAAGSVRGKLHAHRALWREDSFALTNIEAGTGYWSVVAVSDGAGSAPLSRVGSKLACAAALDSLRSSLGAITELSAAQEELIANALPRLREALIQSGKDALDAIRIEAGERGKPISAFAATLLVLVRREWQGSQLIAALQIGDGSIALLGDNGLTLLGEADHGQHSSETRFLTTNGIEADLASRVKFSIKNDLVALAVMSDGVSDDYFPEDKRLGEVFDAVLPLVRPDDEGAALIEWLGYEKKGSSDDRTLVIGWLPQAVAQNGAVQDVARSVSSTQTEAPDGETKTADGDSG
jgi:serine/threonine protein phosphatase PrpC